MRRCPVSPATTRARRGLSSFASSVATRSTRPRSCWTARRPPSAASGRPRGCGCTASCGVTRVTPERWARIKDLLEAAGARAIPERDAFLDQACGDDAALRRELAELLDLQAEMGDFLEVPLLAERGAP